MMLTKEKFVECIRCAKEEEDAANVAYAAGIDVSQFPSCQPEMMDLLQLLMNDYSDEGEGFIRWWCYDRDFGKNFKIGDVKTAGEPDPDLSTDEKLYDFLANDEHDPVAWATNILATLAEGLLADKNVMDSILAENPDAYGNLWAAVKIVRGRYGNSVD